MTRCAVCSSDAWAWWARLPAATTQKRTHNKATDYTTTLHWLPIRYRIRYKIALVTFKVITFNEPVYLAEMLCKNTSSRGLRSSSKMKLTIPQTKLKNGADRSFSVSAPRIWNDLPDQVKQSKTVEEFKKKLKTHLFKLAFQNCEAHWADFVWNSAI